MVCLTAVIVLNARKNVPRNKFPISSSDEQSRIIFQIPGINSVTLEHISSGKRNSD